MAGAGLQKAIQGDSADSLDQGRMGSRRTDAGQIKVLIVDEGHAGHSAQSRGFVHHARRVAPSLEVETLAARLRTPGILRSGSLALACHLPSGLPAAVLERLYEMPSRLEISVVPDLIVSSGGQGAILAASLAKRFAARWIFCGDCSGIDRSRLDIVVSPVSRTGDSLWVRSEILFSEPLPEPNPVERKTDPRLAAVLIGGPSRSHRYAEEDWVGLAQGLRRMADDGWRFLLTTSARTPADVEARLRRELPADALRRAVWWHDAPERLARQFLADADTVLVTQDSLTMTSEAIGAQKPVFVLAPDDYRPSGVLEAVLAAQEAQGRIVRHRMRGFATVGHATRYKFLPLDVDALPDTARQALALAGFLDARELRCS